MSFLFLAGLFVLLAAAVSALSRNRPASAPPQLQGRENKRRAAGLVGTAVEYLTVDYREAIPGHPPVTVQLRDITLSCRLHAPVTAGRFTSAWSTHDIDGNGERDGFIPESNGALLKAHPGFLVAVRVLLDSKLQFSLDDGELVVRRTFPATDPTGERASFPDDVELQVVALIKDARVFLAALEEAASSLPALATLAETSVSSSSGSPMAIRGIDT